MKGLLAEGLDLTAAMALDLTVAQVGHQILVVLVVVAGPCPPQQLRVTTVRFYHAHFYIGCGK